MKDASRATLAQTRRLVVKLGTNVIMRADGLPALGRLYGILESIATVGHQGKEVLLVTSGAIGLGAQQLGLEHPPVRLAEKQACAAVGQGRLMAIYQEGFARLGIVAAQVLLSEYDFSNRRRYLNLRATLDHLLKLGVVPIINENDTVSTVELEERLGFRTAPVFGDNDKLSALVASGMTADTLLILSDVAGLYTGNPHKDPKARLIPQVQELTPEIEGFADGLSSRGRGGMASKLAAVRVATQAGTRVLIADGACPGILDQVLSGQEVGTLFEPGRRIKGRKRWVAFAGQLAGRIRVNAGAQDALLAGQASLLAAGVVALEGDFERDDVVAIADEQGHDFARGVATMARTEADQDLDPERAEAPGNGRVLVSRDTFVLMEQ
ncbi:MAG: glutamate 5-kinase [Holophaga sp.]|nr:glutamate 5-kinase [Holophaga sp.]